MPRLASLQIQLARFAPDGQPRCTVTRTASGSTHRWANLTEDQVNELQKCFLEDMRQTGALYVKKMKVAACAA